jgi:naphthoate synthase
MDDTRRRRIKVISEHLSQDGYKIGSESNPSEQIIAPEDCAGRISDRSSEIYASATGRPNSYARIHGDVSRRPAQWKNITTVQKEILQETLYHKAHGEGIAKVRHTNCNPTKSRQKSKQHNSQQQ